MKSNLEWLRNWSDDNDGLCHSACSVFSDHKDAKGKSMDGPWCSILQESAPLHSGCKMLNIVAALERHFVPQTHCKMLNIVAALERHFVPQTQRPDERTALGKAKAALCAISKQYKVTGHHISCECPACIARRVLQEIDPHG